MKKKIIFFTMVISLAVGMFLNFFSIQSSENSNDELIISSVEVYTSEEGTSDFGPRELFKCDGGRTHIVCWNTISIPCQETHCQ